LLLYSHLASEIAPGKKIATRFLVLTKAKEPVVEEHIREVTPVAVKRTLAGVERVWRARGWGRQGGAAERWRPGERLPQGAAARGTDGGL
jgi:hypothetical protein